MELLEAIKTIVDTFGKEIIAERRFVYMISDYYSFRDNPAEKRVLTAIVNDGYSARLLKVKNDSDVSIVINQIVKEVCNNYGFREDIVEFLVRNLIKGIGYNTSLSINNKVPSSIHQNEAIGQNYKEKSFQESNGKSIFRGEFTEEYITYIFIKFIGKLPFHAHMDEDKLQKLLSLKDEEAQKLFSFLKKIGVFKFNGFSLDYDLGIDTLDKLRNNYHLYVSRQKGFHIPLHSGKLISRSCLDKIAEELVKNRRISIDQIAQELSSPSKKRESEARDLYQILQNIKIIDNNGRNVSYLMPKAMADYIIKKLSETS